MTPPLRRPGAILMVGFFLADLALAAANFVVAEGPFQIFAGCICLLAALVMASVSPAVQEFLWLRVRDLCRLADSVVLMMSVGWRRGGLNRWAMRKLENWRRGWRWRSGT